MRSAAFVALVLFSMITSPDPASAQTPGIADLRVLDPQYRRIVTGDALPSDASPTCDVLVLGGGVGGVAAANAVARQSLSAIIVEPTDTLGGQFTAQLVAAPDENSYIEEGSGCATDAYRALRERVRELSAALPGAKSAAAKNIGQGWVSRVCAPPEIWATAIEEIIKKRSGNQGVKRVYRRHQIRAVVRLASGLVNYVDIIDLDTGKLTRIGARFVIDATEDGEPLHLAGCPTRIGQEGRGEFGEKHAPESPRPDWVQSFTYCFLLRWQDSGANRVLVERPAEYEYFKSLGEYTLDYVYSERGIVPYKVLTRAEGSGGAFWTYRRLLAANSFAGGKSPNGDIALMNWRGNDFHEESYVGKPLEEQVRVLNRGQQFAQGFCYWLQNECPRDDGQGVGYPEMQLVTGEGKKLAAGVGADGYAVHPYVRESRRLQARTMLTENDLTPPETDPSAKWGTEFADSVGCALYSVDIHPAQGEPHLLFPAVPYHLPLTAFLAQSGAANVLPGAKNIGATRLASASARMHPTEWLAGEVAGSLAAYCIRRDMSDPNLVRDSSETLEEFQGELRGYGIGLSWRDIIGRVSANP